MAATESFVLDGLELSSGGSGPLGVKEANLDPPASRWEWVSGADVEGSALLRDPQHEIRIIELKVQVRQRTTMDLALAQIAAVRDKLKKASATQGGIPLVWTPQTATLSCTFDCLGGDIIGLPVDWTEGWFARAPTISLRLYCAPYWRGTETLTSTASSSTPIVTLEVANIPGDIPALGRLIVTDTASQSRRHVEWGLEGSTYNAATSLLIESDNLVTSGFVGAQSTRTGAYDVGGGNTVVAAAVLSNPVGVCSTGNLAHVGHFRVKARVQTTGTSSHVRLAWAAGDNPLAPNDYVTPRAPNVWQEVDFGLITVPVVTAGTQRWTGVVQAYDDTSATVYVDYLFLVPANDGYGVARSSYTYNPGVTIARDEFTGTTAGNALNARVAPAGGTWATSGDATDFVFEDNFVLFGTDGIESVNRFTAGSETNGRYAILGSTNYTDVQVEVRSWHAVSGNESSVIARWTDSSNHLRLRAPIVDDGPETAYLEMVVAGVVTTIATASWAHPSFSVSYRYRVIAYASGQVVAHVMNASGVILATLLGSSSVLATGGTLQTGKPGIRDRATPVTAGGSRRYTGFSVSTPYAESPAINSGRTIQFRHDSTVRDDSTGTYYGRPNSYVGGYLRIPVGTSRVMVNARRNDVATVADDVVTDATQIQVAYTPRGLVAPR